MTRPQQSPNRKALAVMLLVAGCALCGCAVAVPSPLSRQPPLTDQQATDGPPTGLPDQIRTLGPVTRTNDCQYRELVLPDPACTPGAILADANLAHICRPGFARGERPPLGYSEPIKRTDMIAYGHASQRLSRFVLDHLVPLELGGSGFSRANLWIQPVAQGQAKDTVENYLASQTCAGRIGLRIAQVEIARNWLAVWQQMTAEQRQHFSSHGAS